MSLLTVHKTEPTFLFCCQKCGLPLKLDSNLSVVPDKTFIQEIAGTLPHIDPNHKLTNSFKSFDYTPNAVRHRIATSSHSQGGESDFAIVGNFGQQASYGGLGHDIHVNSTLFDILSSQTEVDHPLCEDCTDALLDKLDQRLKLTEDECRAYKEYLEQLESQAADPPSEDYDAVLSKLQEEEDDLLKKISQLDEESRKLDAELLAEAGKQNDLRSEEQEFLKEYNELKRQMIELEDDDRSVENQLKYTEAQLDKLIKLNAFNATFHIWHNGQFGTINGFRLGRLPNIPVDWNEINTAWGQTVLLLHSLARKIGLVFERYRLVPYGNHSYIVAVNETTKELPLYCAGGFKFFWDTKFDQGMVAFLDCLQQFKEKVEKGDTQFILPYRMNSGKIEDANSSYSIKIQFNSEEQWTKALKYMLTNLRWGLAWVSSQYANND